MKFKRLDLDQFLFESPKGVISILFIRERGCPYCEIAENEISNLSLLSDFPEVRFFETYIDEDPGLATRLALVGVPAFFRVDKNGRKKIKTGFGSTESLREFIETGDLTN